MEQLSIEEKAKRYDIALKKIKMLLGTGSSCSREELEYVFPELKESKGERIRKKLIDFLEYYRLNNMLDSETISLLTDSVAWLEKQGEKKLAKNIVEAWKDMRLEVYQQASGNRHEPNYSDDTTKMFSLNDIDEIIEKMSEQKPAEWSEEDEKVLDNIFYILNQLKDTTPYKEDKTAKECIVWLESIKDRVGCEVKCTTKQWWSEEDEKHIHSIISTIECNREKYKQSKVITDSYTSDLEWLKSLINSCKLSDNFPHWKKSTLQDDNVTGFNSDFFSYKGYYIDYKELFDKLPKDN